MEKKDHLGQLQKCLEECRQNGISLNPKKCTFSVNLGVIFGHIICSDGLLMDPWKITTMPILVNVIKIKIILGIAGFY